jgi:hypothetical protein
VRGRCCAARPPASIRPSPAAIHQGGGCPARSDGAGLSSRCAPDGPTASLADPHHHHRP